MNHVLLRRTVSAMLKEMALTPGPDMALARIKQGMQGDLVFVLYNPSQINVVTRSEDDEGIPTTAVLAHVEVDATGEIHAPVAAKGYGPFIYEVAMVSSKDGIFSDREGRSPSALRVWQRFMTRADVTKTPLEDGLRANDDPMDPTNYRFSMRQDGVDTAGLIANNAAVVKARRAIGDDRFEHRLWGIAHAFFKTRMKQA